MSKGEEKIQQILTQEKIFFEREKNFKDLKHGLFRFDFYIPNLDGAPAIIEFNGSQHYHYTSRFFKTRQQWHKALEHDRRKISYCLANGITIYIIPFWELNNINNVKDLFNKKFIATSRWKNDEDKINSPLNKN